MWGAHAVVVVVVAIFCVYLLEPVPVPVRLRARCRARCPNHFRRPSSGSGASPLSRGAKADPVPTASMPRPRRSARS
jgi:hypothetical protein